MRTNGRIGSSCQNNGSMYVMKGICGVQQGCMAMRILNVNGSKINNSAIVKLHITADNQQVLESNTIIITFKLTPSIILSLAIVISAEIC